MQAAETIAAYRREYPLAAKAIVRLLGWSLDAAGAGYDELARTLCAVAFRPGASTTT